MREENTATVVEQVQTLSDLVTVKYVLEKVVILEDAKWYGENRVLLLAHGIVKAGIDLKRITPDDVTISGKKSACDCRHRKSWTPIWTIKKPGD